MEELDILVGVVSVFIVTYRIVYLMIPMMTEAYNSGKWSSFFQALTLIV